MNSRNSYTAKIKELFEYLWKKDDTAPAFQADSGRTHDSVLIEIWDRDPNKYLIRAFYSEKQGATLYTLGLVEEIYHDNEDGCYKSMEVTAILAEDKLRMEEIVSILKTHRLIHQLTN